MKAAKITLGIIWGVLLLSFVYWVHQSGLGYVGASEYIIEALFDYLRSMGALGGIIFIIIYTLRPLLFFPATLLTALAGAVFGPVWGIVYTFIGENMSANVAFSASRFFSTGTYEAKSKGLIKNLSNHVEENGFLITLLLRLMWAPFDVVNYALGLTKMKQADFFWGTAIGIIPGVITFVLLGDLVANGHEMTPETRLIVGAASVIIFVLSIVGAKILKKKRKDLDVLVQKIDQV